MSSCSLRCSYALVVFLLVGLVSATAEEDQTSGRALWMAAKKGDAEAVQILVDEGTDVNFANEYGATALSFACDRGHLEVVRVLLAAGANVKVKDTFYGASPLFWAAGSGSGEIVRLLLERGAEGAESTLRTGVSNGSLEVVRAVMQCVEVKPTLLRACRDLARDQGHHEIAKLIETSVQMSDEPPIEVPMDILQMFVGTYQSESGGEYTIQIDGQQLRLSTIYRGPVQLRALDHYRFRFFDTEYTFKVDDGKVNRLERGAGENAVIFQRIVPESVGDVEPHEVQLVASTESVASDLAVSSANWPQFRGIAARGIADGQRAPVSWNVPESKGVRWKTEILGLAHSCPIIWEKRVFLTTAVSEKGDRSLRTGLYGDVDPVDDDSLHEWRVLCLDLESGTVIWDRVAHTGIPTEKRHPKSTHANSTPVTDGTHLVTLFGSKGLYCHDMNGNLLWQQDLGKLDNGWFYDKQYQWGFGSSPVLHGGKVIVQCDTQDDSFIAAYDIKTGSELWKTARDEIPGWSTPTVWDRGDITVVITIGSNYARGYDARNGEELWRLSGFSEIVVPTPLVAHDLMYITSGYRPIKPIYAVHPGAKGDISVDGEGSDHVAWSHNQGGPYMPSPMVYRDYLYICGNSGVLACYHATSGEKVYQRRLRGNGVKSFTASPVAADDKLYFTSEEGIVLVVQAGPKFRILHSNPMGEYCLATPAIAQGIFLIRSERHLIAIGQPRQSD